ncbi:MAG TPA: hypothetical protein DEB60_09515, partial [Brevundimonas sp.]|nr:hypothetical protein [Brevundimonas sp.]
AEQAPPAAAAAPIPRAEGAGPALWVVRDADSTVYLFGTVHVLRPGTAWGSDKVDAAFASASDIWVEIADQDDQTVVMPVIQQHGVDPSRPPVVGPVSRRLRRLRQGRPGQWRVRRGAGRLSSVAGGLHDLHVWSDQRGLSVGGGRRQDADGSRQGAGQGAARL